MIYIIRHGQTNLNDRKVLQGRSDFPLNGRGKAQAASAAKLLENVRFDKVYSSPLIRAVETAKIVSPGREIRIDERLTEMDYGPYEGMDLRNPAPEVLEFFRDFVRHPAPSGMEQLPQVVKRAGEFVEECCRTEENLLISTHAIAMKGILEYLTPHANGKYWSEYVGNCAIYVTEYKNGAFTVPKELEG
ncbi:MAG: histidine phosphatase family protein [Erysipelotrichales bacterium]|nr:histidine phosphatase family protein [Erysipelotrichales bacterium]